MDTERISERKNIGRDAAIAMAETNWWVGKPAREIAMTQFFIAEMCCPFDVFHKAIEETLGRPVWTHEFARSGAASMRDELLGIGQPPTMQQIIEMIPEDKRILVVV